MVGGDGGAVVVVVDAASAAVGARSRMAAAATLVAPAKQAAPATRTLLLPLVMLIPCLGSAFEQVPDRGRTSPHDTKWMLSSTCFGDTQAMTAEISGGISSYRRSVAGPRKRWKSARCDGARARRSNALETR